MSVEIRVSRAARGAVAAAAFALVAVGFAPRTARADALPAPAPTPVPTILPADATPPPLIYPAGPTPLPTFVPATEAPSPVPQTPAPLATLRPHVHFHASPPPAWPGATTPAPASPVPLPPAATPIPAKPIQAKPFPAKLIPAKPIPARAIPAKPVPAVPEVKQPSAGAPRSAPPGRELYAPLRYFVNTKWSCETFGGANEAHYYVSKGPYAFTLHSIVRSPSGGGVELEETYAFDWTHRAWKVAIGRGPYRLREVQLGYNDWIFEGTQIERGVLHPFRMRYHMYDDVILRRDFETLRAGTWLPFAGETCERNDFADVRM